MEAIRPVLVPPLATLDDTRRVGTVFAELQNEFVPVTAAGEQEWLTPQAGQQRECGNGGRQGIGSCAHR